MDLSAHDEREQQRYQNVMKNIDSIKTNQETKMSNSNDTNNQSVWGPAAGAFFGAAFGENGFFGNGNRGGAGVTTEQLTNGLNQLQGQLQRDGIEQGLSKISSEICHSTNHIGKDIGIAATGLGLGIAGVKDAVVASSAQNALSLCNLGHNMSAGFAGLTSTVQSGFASAERLALQQALDAERARATELRIGLSEERNRAGHTQTQVLLNQVISGKQ